MLLILRAIHLHLESFSVCHQLNLSHQVFVKKKKILLSALYYIRTIKPMATLTVRGRGGAQAPPFALRHFLLRYSPPTL